MKLNRIILSSFLLSALCAHGAVIESPSGKLKVVTSIDQGGKPVYSVYLDGKTVIDKAPVGMITDFVDARRVCVRVMQRSPRLLRNILRIRSRGAISPSTPRMRW